MEPEKIVKITSAENNVIEAFSNLDAEIALIGCLLWDNRNFEKISDFIDENHFVDENHQLIFKKIKDLLNKNILVSPITLKNYLAEGDFGVLVGHTPLISALRPGVIDVYIGDTVDERIFVAGGFSEVTGARCTVLAEEAVPIDEINQMTAQVRSSAALEAIDNATNAAALTQAEAELAVAEAMVSAAKTI